MANMVDDVMTAPAWEAEMGKSTIYKTIYDAAESAGIDPKEFLQLAQMESRFDPQAESPAGYRGLFQINPEDRDVKDHAGSNLPFITPGLYDPDVNIKFATKRFKELQVKPGDLGPMPKIPFLIKARKYNQGKHGGGEILDAYYSGKSVQEISDAPWNRTKKILNNLSDDSLNILAVEYKLNKIKKRGDRERLIYSMVGDLRSGTKSQKHILEDDPLVVDLYVGEQKRKVATSSDIVDQILKEM